MVNPYLNRTAIRNDNDFVGRTAELKRLFNRIGGGQPQSMSVVGDRRIGKSSLLRAVMSRRTQFLLKPARYLFVYSDMQSRLRWTADTFFERLASELAPLAGVDAASLASYDGLEQWCRSLPSDQRTLVLLIDEFHLLMKDDPGGRQVPVEFFNFLRSLANSYPVSLILTSHVDLYTLSEDHRLSGSPLFNILHKLHLGPFTASEARELITGPSAERGVSLAADESWIASRGGRHPLYLQIACCVAFDWRAEKGEWSSSDREALDRRFLEEARPHFEGMWKQFSDDERGAMAAVASSGRQEAATTPVLDSLEQRGYLIRDDDRLRIFSDSCRDFINDRSQHRSSEREHRMPTQTVPPIKARLFISYASEDRDDVRELYGRLESAGLDPWMDDKDLVVGDPWARTIDEAIQSADFFLVCLSTHSVTKAGVLQQELSRGLDQWYSRAGPDNYLLPVALEECPLPMNLAAVQKVDLWKEDGWIRLRSGLEKAIEKRKTLASPVDMPPSRLARAAALSGEMSRWMHRRALVLGLSLLLVGVILLFAGLSGETLSYLVSAAGHERANNWNVIVRTVEIVALVAGAGFVCLSLLPTKRPIRSLTIAALLCTACWLLIRIEVPAPSAFALAYDRHLVGRSDEWRERLLSFVDPVTGGIKDGGTSGQAQAWTTAQTVVGLLGSVGYDVSQVPQAEVRSAFDYLENSRMTSVGRDGWEYFLGRGVAITEVTAWVVVAESASLRANLWEPSLRHIMASRITRDLQTIVARQTPSGGFSPVYDVRDDNSRTYSTVMALWALAAAFREGVRDESYVMAARRGANWLLDERKSQLGWVPNPRRPFQTEEFPGLSAQALVVLGMLERVLPDVKNDPRLRDAQQKFTETSFSASPIRISARVPDSDVHVELESGSVTLEGSTFLWYPWSRAAFAFLGKDVDLPSDTRTRAERQWAALTLRTKELSDHLDSGLPYLLAEHLLCIRLASEVVDR